MHARKRVEVEVRAGEIIGLIGDNGAGKSTFIDVLTRVFPRDRGEIGLDGREARILPILPARRGRCPK